ncbi:MAG: adenylate cyclase [Abditibacteriota bacterium]|nr:adenylate cyclase [Abditibacteriota bacterium]
MSAAHDPLPDTNQASPPHPPQDAAPYDGMAHNGTINEPGTAKNIDSAETNGASATNALSTNATPTPTALEVRPPEKEAHGSLQSTLDDPGPPLDDDEPELPPLEVPRFSLLDRFDWRARRIELSVVALSLLIALAFVPQLLNFARRDDYTRDTLALALLWQPVEAAEYRLYDARFTARGKVTSPAIDKIAIVAIDQYSINNLREWPWPRDWHAKIVRRLKKAGARVIALDINFKDRQNPGADGSLSPADLALVKAAEDAGNVLISSGFRSQRSDDSILNELSTPFDELDSATPDIALNFVPPSSDGGHRLYVVRGHVSGADLGSFGALAAAQYQKLLDGNENTRFYSVLKKAQWPALDGQAQPIPLTSMKIGDDRLDLTRIFYWGPSGTFKTHPYANVLNEDLWSDAELKKRFNNKIVYVGATADIFKDLFPMPTFQSGTLEGTASQISGVELHATATAQLLEGQFIRSQSTQSTLVTLFGFTLLSSLWIISFREWVSRMARVAQVRWAKAKYFGREMPGRIHGVVWFGAFAVLSALPSILFWQFAVWLFARHNFWLVTIYPLLAGALSSGLALLMLFVVESGERRKTMSHFARQVSPDVLEEILSRPEEDFVRPRRCHITVLFSDLEGFTSYSETHEPEEVVEAMNNYMNRMVPIVESHGGSIDKFIGDAIMAFFGAPIPRYDHPAQALLCAVALQEECARFREETGIPFYMRIGVHSGECIYGEIGSLGRANITVLGDTVNLASRLESKNKDFGSWIMCSSDTYFAASGVVEASPISTGIKGKSQEVEVFLVRGSSGQPEQEKSWGRLEGGPDVRALGENEAPALRQGEEPDDSTTDGVLSLPPQTPDEADQPLLALPAASAATIQNAKDKALQSNAPNNAP